MKRYRDYTEQSSASKEHMKKVAKMAEYDSMEREKAEEVNSNTQLYKQAGNSIVKNVLIAIFGQMMPGKGTCYLRDE